MDCSIVPTKKHGLLIISTCDFFYPNVDDAYTQGKIGACNVLSDMYAMGVYDIDNVLMILAASNKMEMDLRDKVTRQMIEGFNYTCNQADVECTGGQTVVNPWPIIGGTAMSVCAPGEFIEPVSAVVGDVLVLTKPLGTQIAVNLREWQQIENHPKWSKTLEAISVEDVHSIYTSAVESMSRLNKNGARLMHKYKAHGCTDITGFGILGHANNLAQNQKARVDFEIDCLAVFNKIKEVAEVFPGFRLLGGLSAETSGGLFIALPSLEVANQFIKEIEELDHQPAWIVGRVVEAQDKTKNQARISENVKVVSVQPK